MKGLFIVLDGNDGSGKATQAALLTTYLNNAGVVAQKVDFPAYDKNFFGSLIGECLAGAHGDFVHLDPKIASSLYALDRLESSPSIQDLLEQGTVVIADRFTSSNQIHQGGKIANEEERAAFVSWIAKMEYDVLGIPRPDAIVYLQVPVAISQELLLKKRSIKNQGLGEGEKDTVEADHQYVARSFETANWLASREPNWHIVECVDESGMLRSKEDIHADVVQLVQSLAPGVY